MLLELKANNGFPILCDIYLKTNSKLHSDNSSIGKYGRLPAGGLGEEIILNPGSSSRAATTCNLNMTESPKLVNVEYVLFDMDGLLLLINNFF
jgi:hypothetical protein